MEYILYNNIKQTFVEVKEYDVYDKMYYAKHIVPNKKNIKEYMKKNNDNITKYFSKNMNEKIKKIRQNISKIDYKIPLFDICTYNLYLVKRDDVLEKSLKENFRCPTYETIIYTKKIIMKSCKYLKYYLSDEYKNIFYGSNSKKYNFNKKIINAIQKIDSSDIKNKNVKSCEKYIMKIYTDNEKLLRGKQEYVKIKMINIKEKYETLLLQIILQAVSAGYKAILMLNFLEMLDLNILNKTYNKIIDYLLDKLNNEITFVKKNDYMQESMYSRPYFTKNELSNDISGEKLNEIIINKKTLIKHNMFITKNKKINLIKYYTLNGSALMNRYLRGINKYKNEYVENLINLLVELIYDAPSFNNKTVVYRTIHNNFLSSLKIGETYTEYGILSTTRDKFFTSEHYSFGDILLCIEIPTKQSGIALCIETVSIYPEENEIIFPPLSQFKLIKKEENVKHYYSGRSKYITLKWKYFFIYVGKKKMLHKYDKLQIPERDAINLFTSDMNRFKLFKNTNYFINIYENIKKYEDVEIKVIKNMTQKKTKLEDIINYFIKNMLDINSQFKIKVNKKIYVAYVEFYNSTNAYVKSYDLYGKFVYKKLFVNETTNGFSISCIHGGSMFFFIEIFEKKETIEMHVNYTTQFCGSIYTFKDNNKKRDGNLLYIVAQLGYFFNVNDIYIYGNYIPYKITNKPYNLSMICADIYIYMTQGKKRFENYLKSEIIECFSYEKLDMLKFISPEVIINSEPKDELYRTYQIFKLFCDNTIYDFMIWLYTYNDELIDILINRCSFLQDYKYDNPFDKNTFKYKFNYVEYLINRKFKIKQNLEYYL